MRRPLRRRRRRRPLWPRSKPCRKLSRRWSTREPWPPGSTNRRRSPVCSSRSVACANRWRCRAPRLGWLRCGSKWGSSRPSGATRTWRTPCCVARWCSTRAGVSGPPKLRRRAWRARAGKIAIVEQRRYEDQPAHADALLGLQVAHDLRPANPAIAFTGDVFRRRQAIVFFQPAPDHQRNRADVAVDGIEALARVVARRHEAAVAGADGIDENHIREVEPGLGVRQQVRRSRRHRPLAADRQPPRSGITELQPCRRRTGTAVEEERDRTLRTIAAVDLIRGVDDVGLRLALVVEQPDRSRNRGEVERTAGQCQRVFGGGIRRQPMLLGGRGRRTRVSALASASLARWQR